MKDYKSIEEFTFDDCFKYLRENPDSKYREIVENRFETVKAETENLDGDTFSKAKTIADLKRYLETDFPGASYYQKKHVKEAEERLRIMIKEAEENVQKEKRAKRIKIGIISALAFLALALVCWLTYQPATYLNVSPFEGEVSKYGSTIKLTYSTDANRVEVESNECISDIKKADNRIVAFFGKNPKGPRSGRIKIIAHSTMLFISVGTITKTIEITQESGLANFIRFDNSVIKVEKTLKTDSFYEVPVRTDGTSWTAEVSDPSWMIIEVDEDERIIKFKPVDNDEFVRSGFITVEDNNGHHDRIEVKQNGKPSIFELSTYEIIASPYGGTATINVTQNSFDELSVDTKSISWLSASVNGNSITIKIDENNSFPHRVFIYVYCGDEYQRIKVIQHGYIDCKRCNGTGKMLCNNRNLFGNHYFSNGWNQVPCPTCNSLSQYPGRIDCKDCDGSGKIYAQYEEPED